MILQGFQIFFLVAIEFFALFINPPVRFQHSPIIKHHRNHEIFSTLVIHRIFSMRIDYLPYPVVLPVAIDAAKAKHLFIAKDDFLNKIFGLFQKPLTKDFSVCFLLFSQGLTSWIFIRFVFFFFQSPLNLRFKAKKKWYE